MRGEFMVTVCALVNIFAPQFTVNIYLFIS